jgi:prevent-host-death family protein
MVMICRKNPFHAYLILWIKTIVKSLFQGQRTARTNSSSSAFRLDTKYLDFEFTIVYTYSVHLLGGFMVVSIRQLRIEPGRFISQAANGQEITITYRGKPRAKIVPLVSRNNLVLEEGGDELFGIWKNRKDAENVEQFVRNIRKGRKW